MRIRSAKQVLLLLAAFAALLVPSLLGRPIETASARACTFGVQFREIQRIAPEIVGDCMEPARVVPVSGDVLQQTTEGLLVWRNEDGWTAFTTSSNTWVLGKSGLQERTNDTRFAWEPDANGGLLLAEDSSFKGRTIARSMQQEETATEEPSPTPEPVAVGTLVASGVAGSAQTARFNFQSTIDRPGNFRVRANFTVTGPASIGHTNGLFTSSEQGDFAPQPYDPAPVVNGRRGSLNWPPDSAATPMGIQGRAFGEVFVQCLSPGNVTGSVRIEFIQEEVGPLVYTGSANVQCTSADIFIPTPVPTETPEPTSTPTQTPTSTMTPTLDETQAAQETANAEATDNAAADATGTAEENENQALGTATAEVRESRLRLTTDLRCQTRDEAPFDRIVRMIVNFFQGGERVEEGEISGRLLRDGTVINEFDNLEFDNGRVEEDFSAATDGSYRVEIDNAEFIDTDGDTTNVDFENAADDDNNSIDNDQRTDCPGREFFFDGADIEEPVEGETSTITVGRTDTTNAASVEVVFNDPASSADLSGGTPDFTINGASAARITLAFAIGEAERTFTVETVDDGDNGEPAENIVFALENPTGGFSIGGPDTIELTMSSGEVFFDGASDFSPDEGDTVTVTITRSVAERAASVNVVFDDDASSAAIGSDFELAGGTNPVHTVNFAQGETSVDIEVDILVNDPGESQENIVLRLENATEGADIVSPTFIELTIQAEPDPSVEFHPSSSGDQPEEVTTFQVTVQRDDDEGAASVDVVLDEGDSTADIGDDFTLNGDTDTTVTINFTDGDISVLVSVEMVDDSDVEGDELIVLRLENPEGLVVDFPDTAEINILDDDD